MYDYYVVADMVMTMTNPQIVIVNITIHLFAETSTGTIVHRRGCQLQDKVRLNHRDSEDYNYCCSYCCYLTRQIQINIYQSRWGLMKSRSRRKKQKQRQREALGTISVTSSCHVLDTQLDSAMSGGSLISVMNMEVSNHHSLSMTSCVNMPWDSLNSPTLLVFTKVNSNRTQNRN